MATHPMLQNSSSDGAVNDYVLLEYLLPLDPCLRWGHPHSVLDAVSFLRRVKHDESTWNPNCTDHRKRSRSQAFHSEGDMAMDMLNDSLISRFQELSSILEPGKPPEMDRATILSDAVRTVIKLRDDACKLKELINNRRLKIDKVKIKRNKYQDEKLKLKAEKTKLEQQLKALSLPAFFPHPPPMYMPAPPGFSPHHSWTRAPFTDPRHHSWTHAPDPRHHSWTHAPFTDPRHHSWTRAPFTDPRHHSWTRAPFTDPRHHSWTRAPFTDPRHHSWTRAPFTDPRHHSWTRAPFTDPRQVIGAKPVPTGVPSWQPMKPTAAEASKKAAKRIEKSKVAEVPGGFDEKLKKFKECRAHWLESIKKMQKDEFTDRYVHLLREDISGMDETQLKCLLQLVEMMKQRYGL